MTRINTNIGALRGLRNVAKSNQALQTSLQRLSTGLKINNGADNPSGLIAGESLRLQITTIEQSVKNSNRANNVISTADSALGEISGLLNQVRGLVQEALNVGALSEDEVQANQSQVDAALSAIDRISSNTSFAGDKLLDGSKAFITNLSTTDAAKLSDFQVNEAIFGTQSSLALTARVTTAAEKGELRYNGGTLSTATTLEVAGSTGNQVLYLGGSSTVGNIKDAINAVADATGVAATLKAGVQVGGGTPVAAVAATLSAQSSSAVTAVAATRTATTVTAAAAVAASRTFTNGTAGTGTVTVTADNAGTAGNNLSVVFADPGANSSALSASIAGNVITVSLATDGTGALDNAANTADLVRDAINSIAGKTFTATSNGGTGAFIAAAGQNLTGGAAAVAQEQITFTADTANAAGNNLNVSITAGGSNSVSVTGNTITITRAAGTTTAQLVNFLNTDASAGAVAFQALATASGAGTTAIDTNVAAGNLSGGVDAAAADNITFTADTAGFAGNNLTVSIAAGGANAVSVTGNAITITRAAGTTTAQLVNFLNTDTSAGALAFQALATASGTGTRAIDTALATTNLAGGNDAIAGGVRFVDARAEGTSGTLSVVFADPGSNSATLGVTVGAANTNGDRTITVNLATNAAGDITTTAADIVTLINSDATASTLLRANASDAGVVAAAASTSLTQGDDAELVLKSNNFGSQEAVAINVLTGSFATTLNDATTVANRDVGTDIAVTINGQAAVGRGLKASIRTSTLDANLTFKSANNVANTTATVNINGGGSLFQIGQEATQAGQVGLGIEAVNTARLGGLTGKLYELSSSGGKSLIDLRNGVTGSGSKIAAKDLTDIIDQALNRVTSLRGRLGSIQKNVIETNISTLGVALENITEARSQIVDTDFAEETAALQRNQVLSQAGISVLGIANQNPQQVLSLLR